MYEVVAQVWRGELVESVHHGAVAALDSHGHPVMTIGDPTAVIYPRSSNKPLQALAMVRHGMDLPGELLALACASHSGEDFHLEGVRRILASAGLTEDALQCTPGLPLGTEAMRAHLAASLGPATLYMNCSGKHAAMLATCVVAGWPTDGYLDAGHPLQQAIQRTIEETSGEAVGAVGVDGCGAPVFGISLRGLATAPLICADARLHEGWAAEILAGGLRGSYGCLRRRFDLLVRCREACRRVASPVNQAPYRGSFRSRPSLCRACSPAGGAAQPGDRLRVAGAVGAILCGQ